MPDHAANDRQTESMKVLSAASEVFPLVKTGGLADVTGALPAALKAHGVAVTTLVPGYPAVISKLQNAVVVHNYDELYGGSARLLSATAFGLDLLVLDAPHLFDRPGNIYVGPDGLDWPDNALRFVAFGLVAAQIARGNVAGSGFDLVHLHDWQAGLAAAHLHYHGGPPSVITVHNLAFQGHYPASIFPVLGLPASALAIDGIEYFGGVGYLKAGLQLASAITTVSPTYAQEIMTSEFGMALDGLLRYRASSVHGILNGIDTDVWNPVTDRDIAQTYSVSKLVGREKNKRAIEKRFGLETGNGILFCVVSRLTSQKGMDLVLESIDMMLASGARLAVLGSGDKVLEAAFAQAAHVHKGRIGFETAYDEKLSHLLQAGADCILVPSRFEPCGLTQLCGLRYGCVPLVSKVGGLADTVTDGVNGFVFSPVAQIAFDETLARAIDVYANRKSWNALQTNGMSKDVSWTASAARYAELFTSLVRKT
jgi:starch synthase